MLSFEISNIILSVVLISSFIIIFFFTYASFVEKNIVKSRCKMIVEDLTGTVKNILPPEYLKSIQANVSNIKPPNLIEEDKYVNENNKLLMKKSVKILIVILCIGISIVFILHRIYKFPLKQLILTNLVTLLFAALTEFSFLTFFAQNYITIDSNFIKYKILDVIVKSVSKK